MEFCVPGEVLGKARIGLADHEGKAFCDVGTFDKLDQLGRQFWVSKEQVAANKYDLSASRYRQVAQEELFYELPRVTMERLLRLEQVMTEEIRELEGLIE